MMIMMMMMGTCPLISRFTLKFYIKIVLILIIINVFLTVVWNPWAQKAMAMSDFGDDEVCFFPESSKV